MGVAPGTGDYHPAATRVWWLAAPTRGQTYPTGQKTDLRLGCQLKEQARVGQRLEEEWVVGRGQGLWELGAPDIPRQYLLSHDERSERHTVPPRAHPRANEAGPGRRSNACGAASGMEHARRQRWEEPAAARGQRRRSAGTPRPW